MEETELEKNKFYQLTVEERRALLVDSTSLGMKDAAAWSPEGGLSLEAADQMIENAVGVFGLPLGVDQNL
jgi:Hydroxymethylglutaryl-CoA reductase